MKSGAAILAFLLVLLMSVAACGSSSAAAIHPTPSPSPSGGYLGSLGSAGCAPGAPFHPWKTPQGQPEVGVDSSRGNLWVLFFNPVPPQAGTEIKVVWRMTGSGPFTFRLTDTGGTTAPLVWGPDQHGGSNWDHPGDEVGTGLNFPHAGCWDIHIQRANTGGDLWLKVIA